MWKTRFAARRLQTQLLVWTAVILIASVAVTFEVRTQLNLRNLEKNLRERNETLVRGLDKSLMLYTGDGSFPMLEDRLRELVEFERTLQRLDIVERRGQQLVIVGSSALSPESLIESFPPITTTEIRSRAAGRVMITTHPIDGTRYALVAVNSMEFIDAYKEINRSWEVVFAAVFVLVMITLMNIMFKRTVSKRFDELLNGIRHATDGSFSTSIPEDRQDEIGIIAKTLNNLLAQIRSFNTGLQREIANATEVLNARNVALEETTRQMLLMQRQLLQAERLAATGQMAATFAHEIGSPMSSLSAHVQLMLEDSSLTREQRETLTLIRGQIQSMVQIVNDLLRSARRGPSDFVLADVNETIETVLQLVQPKLMSQQIQVHSDFAPLPKVRAYPLYLQEAFLNLINNASDAMPKGGTLELRTWFDPAANRVNIRISDTGPGIDASVLQHLFDHFVTTKSIGEGAGLGLGIVKEIVSSHRGNLTISPASGCGTAAHITFPPDPGGAARA